MAFRIHTRGFLFAATALALASCSGGGEEAASDKPAGEQAAAAPAAPSEAASRKAARSAAAAPSAELVEGDWVLAPWQDSVNLFPGVVGSRNGDSIAINFDDGTTDTRAASEVRPFDWDQGTGIECMWTDGAWYNATILTLADDGYTLRVRYDDDGVEENTNTGKCRTRA